MDPNNPLPQSEADDMRILNDETPETPKEPKKEEAEVPEEEQQEREVEEEEPPSDLAEKEEAERLKETIEEEEEDEEKLKLDTKVERSSFQDIQKKYPGIFKEFPDLRDVYHRDAVAFGPSGLFSNVEEARQAVQASEALTSLDSAMAQGDFPTVLKTMDEKTLTNFAENVMPSLHAVNPRLFFMAIAEPVAQMLNRAYKKGEETKSEAMKNSVLNMCNFVYGRRELPKIKSREVDPEVARQRQELEDERSSLRQRDFVNFRNSTNSIIEKQLRNMVMNNLDSNNELSDFTRNAIVTSTIKKVGEIIKQDEAFKQSLRVMFDRAARNGNYTTEVKSQIVSRYLGRVKNQIGSIKSQIKAEALGRKTRSPQPRRLEPSKDGNNQPRPSSAKGTDAKKIDWGRTSDEDILNDKVTLRK